LPRNNVPPRPVLCQLISKSVTEHTYGHGRYETRTLTTSSMLKDYLDWPYLEQVFKLERRFISTRTGEFQEQVVYGFTSLSREEISPKKLLKHTRSYWGIENGLHYRRDVTFQEDHTRMTHKSMARAMTIINNLVISLLNRLGFSNHAQARRFFDAYPEKALSILF